ncbi:MAG: NAD-dependent formate dehydrogenase delta subunit FdsD [Rhodobacteraceae bacterium HLUCCA08]|nr:MAG: NAD-dependent formate dehydrogenase delta subunit FdsD [Rhodobacteraceae bacterium HLUCCA08]
MQPDKLVRMANQIATFFDSQPEADKAGAVAAHLIEFWEPRMRGQMAEILRREAASGLTPLAREGAARACL